MSGIVQLEINEKNRWVYFTKYRWVAHVGYWIWVFFMGTFIPAKGPITADVVLNHFFLDNVVIASFFYFYCLYLIPYFFKRNKYFLFWVLVIASYLLSAAIDVPYERTIVHLTDPPSTKAGMSFKEHYFSNLNGYLFNFLFFSIMLFFMEKNEENHTLLETEKEKKEIEEVKLNLLKTNISPDFLLRSLSQLKRAALVPETYTPDAILTFSDLLRYRLYRGRQTETPLAEELQALQSFVHFIQLDHIKNNLEVTLNMQGDAEDKFLAPLSLVNLLEPFCKTLPLNTANLDIILLIEADELFMEMYYSTRLSERIQRDLEEYGVGYNQLYGNILKFYFEDCEDESCIIRLALPLANKKAT